MLRLAMISVALLATACPKPRTTAATQPTPAAFDPAGSDPAAIAAVDTMLTALGGDGFGAIKELRFTVKYTLNDELKLWGIHQWDKWNGRHNFRLADLKTMAGKPEDLRFTEVRYDLFDLDKKPYANYGGQPISYDDAVRAVKTARERLRDEGYMLSIIHKLKDPGVHLALDGTATDLKGVCLPECKVVKVTFDPGVGTETWFIDINSATNLPEAMEQQRPGGRIGYKMADWTEAGGVKFPTKFVNLGLEGEVFTFSDIAAGEPEDLDYEHNIME